MNIYHYIVIGQRVKPVEQAFGTIQRIDKPKPCAFTVAKGDTFTQCRPNMKMRNFKVRAICAPSWAEAVKHIKASWGPHGFDLASGKVPQAEKER